MGHFGQLRRATNDKTWTNGFDNKLVKSVTLSAKKDTVVLTYFIWSFFCYQFDVKFFIENLDL